MKEPIKGSNFLNKRLKSKLSYSYTNRVDKSPLKTGILSEKPNSTPRGGI